MWGGTGWLPGFERRGAARSTNSQPVDRGMNIYGMLMGGLFSEEIL